MCHAGRTGTAQCEPDGDFQERQPVGAAQKATGAAIEGLTLANRSMPLPTAEQLSTIFRATGNTVRADLKGAVPGLQCQ